MDYFMSVDYGGTNTKVMIFDCFGNQIAMNSFETLKIENIPGYREVDLQQIWSKITSTIKQVIQKAEIDPLNIKAIICIGHGKGLYVLDKNNKEFMNGILSTDSRAIQLAQLFEHRVMDIWPFTHQHVVAAQSPVLLKWLKEHLPECYKKIGTILSAKDYIRFKLTGMLYQEYGDVSGNNLINFETMNYDKRILNFFEIEEMEACLPPLIGSQEIAGYIKRDVANETGLPIGIPVLGGLFDIHACAIGSGVLKEDAFSVIAGTWNINTYPSRTPATFSSGQMTSYFPNGKFLIEESSATSAGNLDAMLKILMSEELVHAKEQGKSIYELLELFLEETTAVSQKLLFFPFLYGSNTSPDAKACFLGLTRISTKSEMIRAVYEGIVFAHKQHIERLILERGEAPEVIRISGGAARSKAWMQMFADILNIPVETIQSTELGGLGGAVIAHATLLGKTLESSVEKMVKVQTKFLPREEEHKQYSKKYAAYCSALEAMKPIWTSLSQL